LRFSFKPIPLTFVLLAGGTLAAGHNSPRVPQQTAEPTQNGGWSPVSDDVPKRLTDEGKKLGYPGGTAGVSVDRATGEVRIIVPDQGIWISKDHGAKFSRLDDGKIGGRCETGYALNADPAGKRLACFMLDGASGMTLDGGKTWQPFTQMGRGWDYGVADWSRPVPEHILAVHHESGADLHHSADGGKTWIMLGKDYTAIGLFDAQSFVASKGDGIMRSTDGGATWTKVSDKTPTGRILCVFKGVGYWVSRDGLLISKDRGLTWTVQGAAMESAWGPFFGKDARHIAVLGRQGSMTGIWRSDDAGASWTFAVPFPEFGKAARPDWTPSKQWAAGWFTSFGWDPFSNTLYASQMGHPALRCRVR